MSKSDLLTYRILYTIKLFLDIFLKETVYHSTMYYYKNFLVFPLFREIFKRLSLLSCFCQDFRYLSICLGCQSLNFSLICTRSPHKTNRARVVSVPAWKIADEGTF